MSDHFKNIKLLPSDFISYLLSPEVGFSQSECLGYTRPKGGPAQPMYMLTKRDKSCYLTKHDILQEEES